MTKFPPNTSAIGCKWVLKVKADGSIGSYKVRLVAKGYSQKEEAPQMDAKMTFLNGELDEIFIFNNLNVMWWNEKNTRYESSGNLYMVLTKRQDNGMKNLD